MSMQNVVFEDVNAFVSGSGQLDDFDTMSLFKLYVGLIGEEVNELYEAIDKHDNEAIFDALLDIIYVAAGAGIAANFPMAAGWDQVQLANRRKLNPSTGRLERDANGKVKKPPGWRPPNLKRLLEEQYGQQTV